MSELPTNQPELSVRLPVSSLLLGVLVLALLAGTALRFSALSRQSYWYDEVNGIRIASRPYAEMLRELEADASPPLYYFCLHPWLHTFGDTETSTRAFSALFGVLLLPCIFLAGRRLFDAKTAYVALVLAAVAHFHVYYSQEARMYSMLGLFTLLSMISHHQAWQTGRATAWAQFILWTVLAMYTHNYGVFVALAGGVYGLSCWHGKPGRVKAFALSLLLTGLLYLPWFLFALRYQFSGTAITGGWLPPLKLSHILDTATSLSSVRLGGTGRPAFWVALAGLLAYIGCCGLAFRSLRFKGERDRAGNSPQAGLRIACLYFVIPLAIPMLVSVFKPIFLPHRYSMAAWPAFVLLAAVGMCQVRRPALRWAVVVAIAANTGLSLLWHFAVEEKASDRDVAAVIAERLAPQDCIVYSPHWAGVSLSHYLRNPPHQLGFPARALAEREKRNEARQREPRSLETMLALVDTELARLGGRLFLVRTRWEPKGRELRDALDERLQLIERQGFHDTVEVSLYGTAAADHTTVPEELE